MLMYIANNAEQQKNAKMTRNQTNLSQHPILRFSKIYCHNTYWSKNCIRTVTFLDTESSASQHWYSYIYSENPSWSLQSEALNPHRSCGSPSEG